MFFSKKESDQTSAVNYKLVQSNKFLSVQFSLLEAQQAGAFIDEAAEDKNSDSIEKVVVE